MFDTHVPGSVSHFSTYFNDITDFDIFPSDKIIKSIFYVPEMLPHSLNFYNAGYESNLFLITNRAFIVNIVAFITFLALHGAIYLCTRRVKRMQNSHNKIMTTLYWNSGIRFFAETYMVCFLFALLNIRELESRYGLASVTLSNVLAMLTLIAGVVLPIFFCVYYYRKRNEW